MGKISELECVNYMLRHAGQTPVNSLADDGVNDTDVAQNVLKTALINILSEDQHFNKKYVTLARDTNGRVAIGDNILFVEGRNSWYYRNLTVKNSFLYDLANDTNIFTSDPELMLLEYYEFEDCPTTVQKYIQEEAAVEYQAVTQNDPQITQLLANRLFKAKAEAEKMKRRQSNYVWTKPYRGLPPYKMTYRNSRLDSTS